MGKIKKTQQKILKNSLEAIQGYSSDAVKSVAKMSSDEVSAWLGLGYPTENPTEKQKEHNGEVEVFNKSHEKKAETHARAHIEYHDQIRKVGEHMNRAENQQLTKQVQEILAELQNLIKSSKVLEMEFAQIAVEQTPNEVGNYDLTFFEWMLLVIKQAREKVEDSGAWLSAIKGKNGKKGNGYWDMFKKHGTSFGMSNERSAATSVG